MNSIRLMILTGLTTALTLAACSTTAERRERDAQALAVYHKHAGAPVEQIRSFRLQDWQSVDERTILLEARLNDWYMVEVRLPCQGLEFANVIGIRNTMNTVQARFDSIVVEGMPCRIDTIRPVDAKAARRELRELRARG